MGLDIFFSEDIRNALLAADEASASTAAHCPDDPILRAYLEGYRAALTTMALAFGLAPSAFAAAQGAMIESKIVGMLERE